MNVFFIIFILLNVSLILNAQSSCQGTPTVIYEGKTYNTVQIGQQCWLKENLNVGTLLLSTQHQNNNGIIEKYCYDSDNNNCNIYGGLYQWDEAMQYIISQGAQGICPNGWHIPKQSELQILQSFVSNNSNALKEVGQGVAGGSGTNSSGFSALLSGLVNPSALAPSINLGIIGYYWSSTGNSNTAYYMGLSYIDSVIFYNNDLVDFGMSIRCLKNTTTDFNGQFPDPSPDNFYLYQNFPNPFNPLTKIEYSVSQYSNVVIKVFDILSNEIETLVNEEKPAGKYVLNFNAVNLTSGLYFYKLQAGTFVQTRKMILLK